jgi:hypothetical protein
MPRAKSKQQNQQAKFWALCERPISIYDEWYYSPRGGEGATPTFFNAIKEIILLKKLADLPQLANGEELKNYLEPNRGSYAIYWLRDNRRPFDCLIELGLITHSVRNSAPYGYGDDEEYRLTEDGYKLVSSGYSSAKISQMISHSTYSLRSRFRSSELLDF